MLEDSESHISMVVLILFDSGLATKLLRRIDGGNSGECT